MASVENHPKNARKKKSGAAASSQIFGTKSEAVRKARKVAASRGAHVIVKAPNGRTIAQSSVPRAGAKSVVIVGRVKREPARGTVARRVPTKSALEAQHAFSRLRGYFATAAALGRALGWSAPTVLAWMQDGRTPARPRESSVEMVHAMLLIADAAREWVSDPFDVGEWLVTPVDELGGLPPCKVVQSYEPKAEGAKWLVSRLARIAPRTRKRRELGDLDFEAVSEILDAFDAGEVEGVQRVDGDALDLTMFDD